MLTFFILMLISGGCFYHAYRQKRILDRRLKEMQERINERNAQPCDCDGDYCATHDCFRDEDICEDDEFDDEYEYDEYDDEHDYEEEEYGYRRDDGDYDDYSDSNNEPYSDYSDDRHYDDVESDELRDELMEWNEE